MAVVCRAGSRLRRLSGGAGAFPRQPALVSAVLSDALQCRHRQPGNATIVLPSVRTYVLRPSMAAVYDVTCTTTHAYASTVSLQTPSRHDIQSAAAAICWTSSALMCVVRIVKAV